MATKIPTAEELIIRKLAKEEAWGIADHDCWPGHCDQNVEFLVRFALAALKAVDDAPIRANPLARAKR